MTLNPYLAAIRPWILGRRKEILQSMNVGNLAERRTLLLGRLLAFSVAMSLGHAAFNGIFSTGSPRLYLTAGFVSLVFGVLWARLTAETLESTARLFIGVALLAILFGAVFLPSTLNTTIVSAILLIVMTGALLDASSVIIVGIIFIGMESLASVMPMFGQTSPVSTGKSVLLILETLMGASLVALLSWERARAMSDVQGERQRLEEVITQSPDALLTVDETGVLTEVSPAIEALLGRPQSDFIGRVLGETALGPLGDLREAGAKQGWLVGGMGESVAVEWSSREGVSRGGDRVWWASLRDVTRRLEAEDGRRRVTEQLHQTQRLEAVGRLAGCVAHDFNNLLTVIVGSSAELQEPTITAEERIELAEEIEDAALRSSQLIRQLLQFSEREYAHPKVFDVRELLPELARLIRRMLGKQVKLEVELSDLPCLTEMDPEQLEQVLINLALNARDAMPKGGTVKITVEPGAEEKVHIAVSDTGPGIPVAQLKNIFEPFYTTRSAVKGTGLGLAVCRGIVTGVGGTIRVTSEPAEGARFDIELQGVQEPGHVDEEDAAELSSVLTSSESVHLEDGLTPVVTNGARILVIDDEAIVLRTVQRVLEGGGFQVEAVDTLELALDVLKEGPVDAVISDVVMPKRTGPEVLATIEQHYGPQRVLFMSGYTGEVLSRREHLTILPKPFAKASLLAAVHNLLRTKPASIVPESPEQITTPDGR